MLRYRLPLGTLMILTLLGLFWLDGWVDERILSPFGLPAGGGMLLVSVPLILLAAGELAAMFQERGKLVHAWLMGGVGIALGASLYAQPLLGDRALEWFALILAGGWLGAMLAHATRRETAGVMAAVGATLLGAIYLGVLPAFYLLIRHDHSPWVIAGLILVVKSCDIGAYFTGRCLGRHKLIPWLSPGKTWEGLIGGLALAGLLAGSLSFVGGESGGVGRWVLQEDGQRLWEAGAFPLWFAVLAGALLGLIGQAGDLAASMLKRDAGVKDSGRSIPGFGGVIDVLDSPIVVAPFAFMLLQLGHWLAAG